MTEISLGAKRIYAESVTDYTNDDDSELVAQARDGDTSAFDELVRRHQDNITGLLFRFCPHRSDLEDMVQETMIKAFRNLDKWKQSAPFANWLKKIAVNTGYDYFRKKSRQPVSIADKSVEANEIALEQLEDRAEAKRRSPYTEEVQRLLSTLPADDRTVLTLQYLHDMPLQEIAEQMNWGLSKTKIKSFRAKRKLKAKLKIYGISQI
ncbi:MAG: RNA polymerase sigma-70 factor (ECF subfamily) [Candidatus Binatia bacterium]|jgi:RNA polymerase sigma-70 factor (ECF subfamily)